MYIEDFVYTELTGTPYTNSETSVTVSDASVFADPAIVGSYEIVIQNKRKHPGLAQNNGEVEVALLTAIDTGTNTLTITRNSNGKGAVAFGSSIDWIVYLGATKKAFDDKQNILSEGPFVDGDKTKLDGIESGAKNDQSATEVPFSPNGDIAASDVQNAIVEVRNDTDTKLGGKSDIGHDHDDLYYRQGLVDSFLDSKADDADLTAHENDNADPHDSNLIVPVNKSSGWTFALADFSKNEAHYRCTSATNVNATAPQDSSQAIPVGAIVYITSGGAGIVTVVAGAGATVNAFDGGVKTSGQYDTIAVKKVSANTWEVIGGVA